MPLQMHMRQMKAKKAAGRQIIVNAIVENSPLGGSANIQHQQLLANYFYFTLAHLSPLDLGQCSSTGILQNLMDLPVASKCSAESNGDTAELNDICVSG